MHGVSSSFHSRRFRTDFSYQTVDNQKFVITVKGGREILCKYGIVECYDRKFLSYKGYKCTLEDYLNTTTLLQRRKSRFQSTELYPTTYANGLIQGLSQLSLILSREIRKHVFLGNIFLHDEVYHPYPPSYLSLHLGNATMKPVFDAHEDRQFMVPISFA